MTNPTRGANKPLKKLREYTKLSQVDFARRLGMKEGAPICRAEQGQKRVGAELGLRILDTYRTAMTDAGITLEDLLRGRFRRRGRGA